MKGALALRKPIDTPAVLDTTGTPVTSGAYITLAAKATRKHAASAILIHNPGAQPLKVATGDAGSEVDTGLVIPINAVMIIPFEAPANTRLSVESVGATQSSGIITCTFMD